MHDISESKFDVIFHAQVEIDKIGFKKVKFTCSVQREISFFCKFNTSMTAQSSFTTSDTHRSIDRTNTSRSRVR